jgi:mono/diheme cytochrome c family protein
MALRGRKHSHLAVLALAELCLLAGGNSARADADTLGPGRDLAERLCATCHMNPGQGEKVGHAGIPAFSAIANRPGQSFEGVVTWLKSAPPMMPNHHLSQDEMFKLAEFIMSLRKNKVP